MSANVDPTAEHKLWCTGPLLHAVQTSTLFDDAKTFVDMPAKLPPSEIEDAFHAKFGDVTPVDTKDLQEFVNKYFEEAGSDLPPITITPQPEVNPEFLAKLTSPESRQLVNHIHKLWFQLTREASADVSARNKHHTLLALPYPFIIPGDRFREAYYWDTYWSIKGMIITGLTSLAQGIVRDLLYMASLYGHVPNGNRVYYINRSQPPQLSNMVAAVYQETNDKDFLADALKVLVEEHRYWTSAPKWITVVDEEGGHHKLTRYYADWNRPRPEAYRMDAELAARLPESERAQLHRDLSSCAESGWDFSSRWCREVSPPDGSSATDLTTIRTTTMLPVDLNSWLYQMEMNISWMADTLGEDGLQERFADAAESRRRSIQKVMWNEEDGQWHDVLMNSLSEDYVCNSYEQMRRTYVCNWVPLYCGCTAGDVDQGEKAVNGLKNSGLLQVGGMSTSLHRSGQQWDHPNGWPPLQHIVVEGCRKYGGDVGRELALHIAKCWMLNCYEGYRKTQHFWEKYDVTQIGAEGGGGEYVVQKGFGWANGVIITFLDEFGSKILDIAGPKSSSSPCCIS